MRIAMLCFGRKGWETGRKLAEGLKGPGREITLDGKSKYLPNSIEESHAEWTKRQFQSADVLIFIGACGIAVRSIAPFVKSKKTDPAVLVTDECGRFVISLLSGHLGGANELTEEAARILGAQPVITTATDLHGRFAVDVCAKKNGCAIFPMEAAKEFSAALLAGEKVGFYSDFPWEGELPEGVLPCDREGNFLKNGSKPELGMAVTIHRNCRPFEKTVYLVPQIVSMGIGCRKGKEEAVIRAAAECSLNENGIYREALNALASIDLKKEEPGILALAEHWGLPFQTFEGEKLREVPGDFSASEFVSSVTGVDNVCERSAVLASGYGKLIQRKKGADGVTTALAVEKWRIRFE